MVQNPLSNWHTCGILTDEARQKNEDEFLSYFGHQLRIVDDIGQIPSKHRSEHRSGDGWRALGVYHASSYAPYRLAATQR